METSLTLTDVPPTVCVLGLGYIGLPLASLLATEGIKVLGVDTNPHVLKTLENGDIHILEPDLHALVKAAIGSGDLRVALRPEPADYFVICVPTPFQENRKADLSYVQAAAYSLLLALRPGSTVILESTVPTGTTRTLLTPILQKWGLCVGEDLFIAYCPERVLPGHILRELVENDRIIGGIDPASTQKASQLYQTFVNGNLHETDCDTAEMVKLVENAYRDVNIAFANELSRVCDHESLNVWEVIQLANKHPRVNVLSPGPGVGGHCIAVDPWFIVEKAGSLARLIRTAREINDEMPGVVVSKVEQSVRGIKEPKIACLGLSYKANVDDIRESPAVAVVQQLMKKGFFIQCYDPLVPLYHGLNTTSLTDCLSDAHCAVVLVDHKEFLHLDWEQYTQRMAQPVVIDTRGALPGNVRHDLAKIKTFV